MESAEENVSEEILKAAHLLLIKIPMPQDVEASTKMSRGRIEGGVATEQPKKGLESSEFHQVISDLSGTGIEKDRKGEASGGNQATNERRL